MGRIEGLSEDFKPSDMDAFKSARRLADNVEPGSWRVFRFGLAEYCNFIRMNPDQIIEDREKSMMKSTLGERRKHEDGFTAFVSHVQGLRSKSDPRKKLAPNSVNSRLMAVRAFYDWNFMPLVKVKTVRASVERVLKVPSQRELGLMLKMTEGDFDKTVILAQAQSGISIGDLLSITWDARSAAWGTVREQVMGSNPHGLVHIHMVREKTKVPFDSFFGKATVKYLKDMKQRNGDVRLFPISKSAFERTVKHVATEAQLHGDVTPHCLRKFFTTQLKNQRINDPSFNNDLVEYWSGHSLGTVRSAYFVPPVEVQALLYVQAEARLTPIYS